MTSGYAHTPDLPHLTFHFLLHSLVAPQGHYRPDLSSDKTQTTTVVQALYSALHDDLSDDLKRQFVHWVRVCASWMSVQRFNATLLVQLTILHHLRQGTDAARFPDLLGASSTFWRHVVRGDWDSAAVRELVPEVVAVALKKYIGAELGPPEGTQAGAAPSLEDEVRALQEGRLAHITRTTVLSGIRDGAATQLQTAFKNTYYEHFDDKLGRAIRTNLDYLRRCRSGGYLEEVVGPGSGTIPSTDDVRNALYNGLVPDTWLPYVRTFVHKLREKLGTAPGAKLRAPQEVELYRHLDFIRCVNQYYFDIGKTAKEKAWRNYTLPAPIKLAPIGKVRCGKVAGNTRLFP